MERYNLKGKKLLILAGAGVHNKVVRAAKEMGIYTIVTDYLPDSPAKELADESWMLNIMDVDGIVKKCKEEHIDGVMNFCIDPAQKPYLEICERLNLPCIGTRKTFDILTDKRKFKDYCVEHGVDVIPEYTEEDILAENVEYPIFIKPTNSRGSRGQTICYSKKEAIAGIAIAKAESSDKGFVCEKYMGNHQDIGSAFFVVNGEPHLVKFGDRYLGREEDNLNKQVICTKLPSDSSIMFQKYVMNRVKKMIKSLGIKFGPVFLQGFVDGNTIRYYDPAQRMPGGDYDVILEKTTGFSTVRSWITFALTGDIDSSVGNPEKVYRLNGGTALLLTITVRPGKVQKIIGLEEVLKMPYTVYGRQIIPEGAEIPNTGDIAQRVAAIGLYIKEDEDIQACVNSVYNIYKVLDENGNSMIVSKFQYRGCENE